jgi:hypothetical protein
MLKKESSEISGDGIFTDNPIKKGEIFYRIPRNITSDHPKAGLARIDNIYVCDEKVLNFINHSCNPNARIDAGNYALVAIRDIQNGEEVTVNYDETELDGKRTKCHCRSKTCRGYFFREI